ncbi:hypothetical protein EV183_005597 [Coemansia sp. RSA 2336]|nr:hypothetical protein EV183_005597 [Coemansia sp. RSA 2336]
MEYPGNSSMDNEFSNCILGCSFGSPVNVVNYVEHLIQCPELNTENIDIMTQHVKVIKDVYPDVGEIQNMYVIPRDPGFSNCILGCSFGYNYSVVEYVNHLIECANEKPDDKGTLKTHLATIKSMYEDVAEIQDKFIN